ncbi:hypothetical protein BJX76DRAFT_360593 [Aspergillus varians]
MHRIITPEQLHQTVEAAVRQRSARYSDSHSLSLRWERDDTLAHQDTGHFQSLLQTLHLPEAQELVIAATDKTPGWTVQGAFREILATAKQTRGRALVVFHYADHGLQDDECLYFAECQGGRRLNSTTFIMNMVMADWGYELGDDDKVDILFLFDCCYSHVACRAPTTTQRIVEIIAATGEAAPLAFCPPRNTVTAKLAGEIRCRQRDGHKYVEFADIVEALRARPDAVKRPTHCLKMGAMSISLPLSGAMTTKMNPEPIHPPLRVVFSAHIPGHVTPNELREFVNWIQSLPEYASIVLEGVYPTSSTLFVLSAPWSVWSKLSGMYGYTFMTEVRGTNMLRQLPAGSGGSPKKKNIPFSQGFAYAEQGL